MTQLSQPSPKRPRRLVESTLSPEEIARRQAIREEFAARCRPIFARLRRESLEDHYNWFIAIDPDNEHYLLDPKLDGIAQKICREYPEESKRNLAIYRLNETGTCGRI